jgi:hypothetical protein
MNPARLRTLERYFEALRRHDWAALAACLAPDVHRTGPYLDEVRGRDAYRDFLAGVVPKLEGYALEVHAVEPLATAARGCCTTSRLTGPASDPTIPNRCASRSNPTSPSRAATYN